MPPDGSVQLTPAERRVLRALEHDLRRGVLAPEPDLPARDGTVRPGPVSRPAGSGPVRRAVSTVLAVPVVRAVLAVPVVRVALAVPVVRVALAVRRLLGGPAALARSAWNRPVPGSVVVAAGLAGTAVGLAIGAIALRRGDLAGIALAGYGAAAILVALAVGAAVDPLAALARRGTARLRARATPDQREGRLAGHHPEPQRRRGRKDAAQ